MLDPTPRGDTTEEESKLTKLVMTDARFSSARWEPGKQRTARSVRLSLSRDGERLLAVPASQDLRRRAVDSTVPSDDEGLAHSYTVAFRFGQNESFRDLTRDAWRWAWSTLNPPVNYIDVDQVRRVLWTTCEAQAVTIDGRTGIPFDRSIVSGYAELELDHDRDGLRGQELECADQLLREGDRDQTERGQKMRETGLAIIASMIQALHTVPLTGERDTILQQVDRGITSGWLHGCGMQPRICVYSCRRTRRELAHGRPHPEWLAWVKQYADWLIQQQRPDGSYPRRWKPGSNEVARATGTASYNAVPFWY